MEMTNEAKKAKIDEAILKLASDPDIQALAKAIEAKPATTQNHYGDYMSVLGQYTKSQTMTFIVSQALIKAGANAQGVNSAVKLLLGW